MQKTNRKETDTMKFVEVKEKFKKGAEKTWTFVKDHKVEIGLTAVTVASGAGLIILGKKLYDIDTKHPDIDMVDIARSAVSEYAKRFDEPMARNIKVIDEGIFTDLAPEIESYVIDNGIEHAVSERHYILEPTLRKVVTVKVEAIHGD